MPTAQVAHSCPGNLDFAAGEKGPTLRRPETTLRIGRPYVVLHDGRTAQAARDLIANPTDSEQMAAEVAKALGGRLHSWYATVGGVHGVMAVFELPPDSSARFGPVPIALSATASGVFQNVQVRRLLTSQEVMESAKQAQAALKAYGSAKLGSV